MSTAVTFLLLTIPITVVAVVGTRWAAGGSGSLRLFEGRTDDPDASRIRHDLDAIRTRFEQQPRWPQSGAVGERR